jgi:EAL domain-containing protein (putative c-di-GMP-specific phosphodiesterase class I)
LQYLHQLPVSLIKIDQSFVRRLPDDKGAVAIIKAAVMLAQNMGIKGIAEGVETREIYDYLAGIGCDMAQGILSPGPYRQWISKSGMPSVRGCFLEETIFLSKFSDLIHIDMH